MISMAKEYETKVLISKKVFCKLLKTYNLSLTQNTLIKNNYFDTTNLSVFNANSVLRIREKNKKTKQITFKQALRQYELIEANQTIQDEQYKNIIKNGFGRSKYKNILQKSNINYNEIGLIGHLITNRWKIKYKDATIFIDHSVHNDIEDYELECEARSAKDAEKIIIKFCKENNINFSQKSLSKYSRFLISRKGAL